jgi:hypothetical protein
MKAILTVGAAIAVVAAMSACGGGSSSACIDQAELDKLKGGQITEVYPKLADLYAPVDERVSELYGTLGQAYIDAESMMADGNFDAGSQLIDSMAPVVEELTELEKGVPRC